MASNGGGDADGSGDVVVLDAIEASVAAAAAESAAAAASAASEGDGDPPFLWHRVSAVDATKYTIDTSFTGGIYDYFVVVQREGSLIGHCRLMPLKLRGGRKFTRQSNSNLWPLAAKSRAAFAYGIVLRAQFNLSFSFCTSPELAALLVLGGCNYTLPTRYEFVTLLMEVYTHCCTLLRDLVAATKEVSHVHGQQLPFIHLTTDIWTAKYQSKAYGTALVSFVDANWKLNIRTLGTAAISGAKTSVNIQAWVGFLLQKATGLGFDALLTCTSDGASDMRMNARTNILGRELKSQAQAQNSVFTHSSKQMEKLFVLQQKGREVGVVPCVVTRWGSVFDMFERLLRLRPALASFYRTLPHSEKAMFEKQFDDWEELAQVVAVLLPFSVLQTQLQRKDLCMREAWMGVLQAYKSLFNPFAVEDVTAEAAGEERSFISIGADGLCKVAHAVYLRLKEEIETRFILMEMPKTVLSAIFFDPVAGHTVLTQLSSIRKALQQQRWEADVRRDPERNFSEAGNLIQPKRSRMGPAKAEAVLMIKSNADLITDADAVPKLSQKAAMSSFPVLFSTDASGSDVEEELEGEEDS
ncbi:ribonuclease H-like domain-containing protein [Tribonema minus]|uniref:Ribonuclease H-like domain-containing protein n=1 Tax=Tribonema minus TaxID=303371 RepID=A0A836CLN8_9STRA|nr:ribonuclease H-like domain-containing protein [Tribonema minus]